MSWIENQKRRCIVQLRHHLAPQNALLKNDITTERSRCFEVPGRLPLLLYTVCDTIAINHYYHIVKDDIIEYFFDILTYFVNCVALHVPVCWGSQRALGDLADCWQQGERPCR